MGRFVWRTTMMREKIGMDYMANKVESGSNGLSQMDKVVTFFLLIVETNFWEISSIRDEIIIAKELGCRCVWKRTFCMCDGLETYAQSRILKVNEATIFYDDAKRFSKRNKIALFF